MKKLVYICSPFRGRIQDNIRFALKWSKYAFKLGYIPICVHCYTELVTGLSEKKGDRTRIMDFNEEILLRCDELWVCKEQTSEGMGDEIRFAIKNGITVRIVYEELK